MSLDNDPDKAPPTQETEKLPTLDYARRQRRQRRSCERRLGDASELLLLVGMVVFPAIVLSDERTMFHTLTTPTVLGFGCGAGYEIVRRGRRRFAGLIMLCFYALATLAQFCFGILNILNR